MIEFREGQTEIFIKKHKVTTSLYDGYLDFHITYSKDEESGYNKKFIRIVSIENKYNIDELKKITTTKFTDDLPLLYFENGGYKFEKINN